MCRSNNIRKLYLSIFYNACKFLILLCFFTNLSGQSTIQIDAPNNLDLNCSNLNFAIISSWLDGFTVTSDCPGRVSVVTNYDGSLPDVCGDPKFVTWIATDECGGIDSSGSVITINTDLTQFGFTVCPQQVSIFTNDDCDQEIVIPTPYARNCFGEMEVSQLMNSNNDLFESGDPFPIGDTEMLFVATDDCGNIDTCRFDVINIPSDDLINLYCPSDENILICSNIDGCGWDSSNEDFIRPGTSFLNCSDVAEVSYRVILPTGQTILSTALDDDDGDATGFTFPLGDSQLCYTIDNPSGSSTCCFNIIVEDCTPPSLICPSNANFSCDQALNADFVNEWLALALTEDNCDASPFVRAVVLDTLGTCGIDNRVELLVIAADEAGNETACIGTINITDDVPPEINVTRLPDQVVECKGAVRNQEIFIQWLSEDGGFDESNIIDNCESGISWTFDPSTTTFQTLGGTCSPNVGFYDVAFTAFDDCGNESEPARARLVFEDTTPPEVTIPDSLTLECDLQDVEGALEDLLADVIVIDSCSTFSASTSFDLTLIECEIGNNELEVFITASDACDNESITMTTVNLLQVARSRVMSPPDLTLRCGLEIDSLIEFWLEDFTVDAQCDSFTVINNFDPERMSLCGSVQEVIWLLRDTCGTASTSISLLTIVDDDLAPVFLNCGNDVFLDVENPDCTTTFLFDFPRAEDCNGDVTITQDFLPGGEILTSGSDFPIGVTELRFFATDICDNQTECSFSVTVRNNQACSFGNLSISGSVLNPNDDPISGVLLTLGATLPEFPLLVVTDQFGNYEFDGLAPQTDYTLVPEFDDSVTNGLSTADLVGIRNHIVGSRLLDTPIQVLAGDANNDGRLSAVDLVLLQNIIIGFIDAFPTNDSWRFIDSEVLDNTTLLPWPPLNEFLFSNLTSPVTRDIIGYKIGDVNNSANVNSLNNPETRSSVQLIYSDQEVRKGEVIRVPIYTKSNEFFRGFQMSLKISHLHFLDVKSNYFNISDNNVYLTNDFLHINAYETKSHENNLMILELEVMKDGKLSDYIQLSDVQFNPEIYYSHPIIESTITLEGQDVKHSDPVLDLYPNPISDRLSFEMSIPVHEQLVVNIYNTAGEKLVNKSIIGNGSMQQYQIHYPFKPGMYILSYIYKEQVRNTKFVVL